MKQKIRTRAIHALLALLLTAGVLLPLLAVMDRSFLKPEALFLSAGLIVLFECLSMHKTAGVTGGIAAAAGAAVWGFTAEGARCVSDVTIAVSLRIRGIDTALPMISKSAVIIMTVLITLLCCFACLKKAPYVFPLLICFAIAVLIWLTDRTELVPWMIPAFVSLLTILMTSGFPETSHIRVLPWSAAIMVLAYILAGNGTAVLPLKNKADELRQSVMDHMFFTEARDVFSLYTVGLSPQGPNQLGGKPEPTDDPVMTVYTPKTAYLRGTVYDAYTGRGWQNTAGGKRYLWQSERMEKERIRLFDQDLPPDDGQNTFMKESAVSVRMLGESTSTLFVPQRIRQFVPGGNMVPYFSNSSELFITRNLQADDSYSVSAVLISSDEPNLENLIRMEDIAVNGTGA